MKDIIIVSIPVLSTIIPSILTYLTNKKIRTLDNVKKEFETKMEANRQEDIARHQETLEKLAELDKKVDGNEIGVIRNRISSFENLCRLDENNNSIELHQYQNIFKDIDEWESFHDIYKNLNGELNIAIENIKEHYKNAKFK